MPEDQKPKTEGAAKVTATLKKPHTHRREQKQPGDKIDVTPAQKERLQQREII